MEQNPKVFSLKIPLHHELRESYWASVISYHHPHNKGGQKVLMQQYKCYKCHIIISRLIRATTKEKESERESQASTAITMCTSLCITCTTQREANYLFILQIPCNIA